MFYRSGLALLAGAFVAAVAWATPAGATKIERVVSQGGLEAWLVRDAAVPVVALEFAFVGGTSQDPADKSGTAYLVSSLLDEGAGDLDARTFQERLEGDAIELRFVADRDYFRGSMRVLKERSENAFDLLRLALTVPRFTPEAVERIRSQVNAELRRESASPNTAASKTWWSTAFPNHPYGQPEHGTLETVARVTPDDLFAYVRRVFARDKLKITLVGDIDAKTAAIMLDQVFGALPAAGNLTPVSPATPQALGTRAVIDFNVPQTVVTFGGLGLPRHHPDFIAAFVVNHIVGGGSFTSRLYQEVREKRGYAYGISTYLYPLQQSALILGQTATRADRTGDAIKVIEDELKRMAESGPTEDELARTKDYLKGSYALRFDSSTKIASQLLQIQLDGLGLNYINERNALVEGVTAEDARRVARAILAGPLLFTIVGRPLDLAGQPARGG
jgi:zinc protease